MAGLTGIHFPRVQGPAPRFGGLQGDKTAQSEDAASDSAPIYLNDEQTIEYLPKGGSGQKLSWLFECIKKNTEEKLNAFHAYQKTITLSPKDYHRVDESKLLTHQPEPATGESEK